MAFTILALVDELILSIIEQIDDLDTLRRLARTSKRLQELTEPAIYRAVFVRSRSDALALASSIVSRPDRIQSVRSIEARLRYDASDLRFDGLDNVVSNARNLQDLTIESPFCNRVQREAHNGWGQTRNALLRAAYDFSLPRLTTLTLHLSLEDVRYWPIDQSTALLFAHPTLRSLKLSCAVLGDDLAAFLNDRPRTPLRSLTLVECNVAQRALRAILALPAALEHFSLGESYFHRTYAHNALNKLFSSSPVAFLESLKQQDRSLKSFGYVTKEDDSPLHGSGPRPLAFDYRECTGLSTFQNLIHISLHGCFFSFETLLKSQQVAPPALQRLTLTEEHAYKFSLGRTEDDHTTQYRWLPPICQAIANLRRVDLISTNMSVAHMNEIIARAGMVSKDRNVIFKMYKRNRMSAMPPFLYREHPYVDEEMGYWEDGEVKHLEGFKRTQLLHNPLEYS